MRVGTRILVICVASALAVGCSADCMSLCEETQDEGCEALKGADCEDVCQAAEDIAEKGDCQDDFDDWMSCLDDADDICKAYQGDCANEADQFEDCVGEYCSEHPNSSSCNDFANAD